jgi:hypothetical protein
MFATDWFAVMPACSDHDSTFLHTSLAYIQFAIMCLCDSGWLKHNLQVGFAWPPLFFDAVSSREFPLQKEPDKESALWFDF